jgi:hypothetical protein
MTALHYAAEKGHEGVAEALLKAGCSKDIQDTVLHHTHTHTHTLTHSLTQAWGTVTVSGSVRTQS